MKTDQVDICKVTNGFLIRIYNYEHNENAAASCLVAKNLDEAIKFVRESFEK